MRGCFYEIVDGFHRYTVLPAYAGMFPGYYVRKEEIGSSPRVCGDVSVDLCCVWFFGGFSPRMRGCFLRLISHSNHTLVLPAYAGMFLRFLSAPTILFSSPRVCGDVSALYPAFGVIKGFSPRMRGCFWQFQQLLARMGVLPAYAGMFLWPGKVLWRPSCSPRVCGDVSARAFLRPRQARFSPRMRGCFHAQGV